MKTDTRIIRSHKQNYVSVNDLSDVLFDTINGMKEIQNLNKADENIAFVTAIDVKIESYLEVVKLLDSFK